MSLNLRSYCFVAEVNFKFQILPLNRMNVNVTFKNYLNTMNTLINSHTPVKKLNKKERKFH